jgi:hypothetical protein
MHQRIMAAMGARSEKSQENWHRPMSGEKNKTIGGKMPDQGSNTDPYVSTSLSD